MMLKLLFGYSDKTAEQIEEEEEKEMIQETVGDYLLEKPPTWQAALDLKMAADSEYE